MSKRQEMAIIYVQTVTVVSLDSGFDVWAHD
jgi:hypothetical protein